jgi:hypothetical protein
MVINRELTSAEKKKSYAKYFYRPMTPPSQETYDILNKGPIDPALALPIEDRSDLLNPGYFPCEKGYCLMPDGSGFIAMLTDMPGVTIDMLEWWFTWHGLESLRYSIWCPDDHKGIRVKPEHLRRRLDTSLPIRERAWNTTDIVDEDIGLGAELMYITFISPADYGYDMNRFKPPAALGAISGNLSLVEDDAPGGEIPMVTFSHFVRPTENGVEVRSRFWLGWQIVNANRFKSATKCPLTWCTAWLTIAPKSILTWRLFCPKSTQKNI